MAVPPPRLCLPPRFRPVVDPAKAALRAELRARRDTHVLDLGPQGRAAQERQLADHLWPLIAAARAVSFYIADGSEMSCAAPMTMARDAGLTILLPHVEALRAPLRFLRWDTGVPLESGWRGLRQPPADSAEYAPDIIVTPLLGYDSDLWRLGQGAGFYDRAFANHPAARRIGVAWAVQHCDRVPRDPWDERLDAIVTERGIIEGKTRHA